MLPAILTALLISLVTQTAYGAGGENSYSSASQKPVGYKQAVALIAAEKYQEAIPPLHSAEKSARNDADIQNLLGFVHRKIGKLDAAGIYYQRALKLIQNIKARLNIRANYF